MSGVLKISAAARLAIHALTHITRTGGTSPLTVADISRALGVSPDHLGKVLQQLARASMLISRRGPGGGFILAMSTPERSLLEVVEMFDGVILPSPCLLNVVGCHGDLCFLSKLEQEAAENMIRGLREVRVRDLAPKEMSPAHDSAAGVESV